MIKEFLEKYNHLKLSLQHLDEFGGCWRIQIYNTTYDSGLDPIFVHYITDEELNNLNLDFETAIMIPVLNWMSENERRRNEK